ncbi:MAG TPA: FAD-binding oxidoreductase [Candidatus Binataceae bacterium]|nr:FAD-binding oxidoreductase [Candidatus Binataceae bacterium]
MTSHDPSAAHAHRVILRFEDGLEKAIDVGAREFVLDAALRQGVPLVHQCRSGSCSTCVARLESGAVEMVRDRALALIAAEVAEGKRLLCSAHALADSVVGLHYPSTLIYQGERRSFEARVKSVEWPADSVARLTVTLPPRSSFAFRAGQYVRIKVPGSEEWRSYSMCTTPRELPVAAFLVRILPGGVMSEYLRGCARAGDRLEIEGPLGAFILHPGKGTRVFVAGGTGLAPILAMLDAIRRGGGPRPKMILSFGCASDKTFFYRDEIELRQWWMPELSVRLSADRVDDPASGLIQGTAVDALGHQPLGDPEASAYVCGPPPMIEAARRRLTELGVPPERIFAERFVASATNAPPAAQNAGAR